MALSDCIKCWDTPCTCGHDWEFRSVDYIMDMMKTLESTLNAKGVSFLNETTINALNDTQLEAVYETAGSELSRRGHYFDTIDID